MSIKPWPSSRHTHPAIDAALGLSGKLKDRDIAKVEVDTYQAAIDLCGKGGVANPHHGKSSIQYCVAAALVDGNVTNASYDDKAFERYRDLIPRITVRAVEPYRSAYPKAWGARVSAVLTEGDTVSFSCENVKGDPELPLSEDEMRAKASASLRSGGVKNPDAFMSAVLAMADDRPLPEIPLLT
jgi:2-methylcitrate dehydratase PrpD